MSVSQTRLSLLAILLCLPLCLAFLMESPEARAEFKITDPSLWSVGRAVAISNDWALVSAIDPSQGSIGEGVVLFYHRVDGACDWEQQFLVRPPKGDAGLGGFGVDVDIDGDTAVVGSPNDDGLPGIYVYCRAGTSWLPEAELFGGARLGSSVALEGNIAAGSNAETGMVDIFVRTGNAWTLEQQLLVGNPADSVARYPLAISGDRLIVGNPAEDSGAIQQAGAAFIYRRNHGVWTLEGVLTASDAVKFGFFGRSVDIHGVVAVAGAARPPNHLLIKGAAYVFAFDGNNWSQQARLDPQGNPPVNTLRNFGEAVAIRDDTVFVGDDVDNHAGSQAGSVSIHERFANGWPFKQPLLTASDATPFDHFGDELDATNGPLDTLTWIVGEMYGSPQTGGPPRGAAYIYCENVKSLFVPELFSLVLKILVGVAEGGGGIVIIPGEGPVPIDPDPFLPVVSVVYEDREALGSFVTALRRQYPPRAPVLRTDDVRLALTRPKTLILLRPRSGREAVLFLAESRNVLRRLRKVPVVLFLPANDPGVEVLKDLWAKGLWQ